MSLDRAKTLLASSDVTDNRNGVALVINAAATCAPHFVKYIEIHCFYAR